MKFIWLIALVSALGAAATAQETHPDVWDTVPGFGSALPTTPQIYTAYSNPHSNAEAVSRTLNLRPGQAEALAKIYDKAKADLAALTPSPNLRQDAVAIHARVNRQIRGLLAGRQVDRLDHLVHLTAEQKTAVRPLFDVEVTGLADQPFFRADPDRRAKILADLDAGLKGVLTADQYQAWLDAGAASGRRASSR